MLDPACGSGNFLYLALQALKDLEHRVQLEAEALGFQRAFPEIGPANVKGIEINPYAAELARVSVWIGEIQWMRRNGFGEARDPILKPLDTIEYRDAILKPDDLEPEWPAADVVIGNPPFLGGKLLITHLGEDYVSRMFSTYAGRVPAEADLVCYWFEKAGRQIASGKAARVGLVATNSIRGGANRRALRVATDSRRIFEAWSDEPWVIDGAAVRVSLVCFSRAGDELVSGARLDGESVDEIYTDLTVRRGGTGVDLTKARRLPENADVAFMGDTKGGAFDVAGDQAREWLRLPANPNGHTNADVLKPWVNGMDLTRRPAGKWIVDFGWTMPEGDAALYEEPFRGVKERVYPMRQQNRRAAYREYWWRHVEPRQGMWGTLAGLSRYIATVRHSKHRLFSWFDARICPDSALIVVARDDDTTFGRRGLGAGERGRGSAPALDPLTSKLLRRVGGGRETDDGGTCRGSHNHYYGIHPLTPAAARGPRVAVVNFSRSRSTTDSSPLGCFMLSRRSGPRRGQDRGSPLRIRGRRR